MDEFESRLDRELRRQASATPDFSSDFERVRGRGRRRLWISRSIGGVVVVAALTTGYVLLDSVSDDGQTVSATDGGAVIVAPPPTPTPEPVATPTPDEVEDPDDEEPVATPDPASVIRDVSLLSATGWGAGLVGPTGDLYTAVVCCQEDDPAWYEQDLSEPAEGATTVRDDLRGGLVTSSANALYWLSADSLASGADAELLATLASDEETNASVHLWDVRELEDNIDVLYSVHQRSVDSKTGVATLNRLSLTSASPTPEALETSSWDGAGTAGYTWVGAAWTLEGGYMSLKRHHAANCEWVEYSGPGREQYSSPFPTPADPLDCPHLSIGAATVNSDGEIAVIERHRSPAPQLVIYDRAANALDTYRLPDKADDQQLWSEIDMVASTVVVSRNHAAVPHKKALQLDETLRVDFESTSPLRPVHYLGSPALARSDISTEDLETLDPSSRLWFMQSGTPGETSPLPAEREDGEVEGDDPTSGSEAGTEADKSPESQEPPLPGADGCLAGICLGSDGESAVQSAAETFGDGSVVAPNLLQFSDPTNQQMIWIGSVDGSVASVAVAPVALGSPEGAPGQPQDPETVSAVIGTLGLPQEVATETLGSDRVLWLVYAGADHDTSFGHRVSADDGEADPALILEGDSSLLEQYAELPINIVRIASSS